jgi:hypothetical protein
MNYQALGEYTAFYQQAKDAADRRFALLHNLGTTLLRLSQREDEMPKAAIAEQLEDIARTEAELHAAVARANIAAALAQKPHVSLRQMCVR